MSWTPKNEMAVGNVMVVTTSGEGHPLEFFAQRITDKLIAVADTAPEPIRTQALAYRDNMYAIVLDGINRAIASDRAYRK